MVALLHRCFEFWDHAIPSCFSAILTILIAIAFPVAAVSGPILQIDAGGHRSHVNALIFSKDGRTLYSAGQDKIIRIWNWKAGKTVRTIRGRIGVGYDGSIRALALTPDEKLLAVGGRMQAECSSHCGDVRIFETETGKLVRTLVGGHKGTVSSLAFSHDGTRLASGGFVGQIAIWDHESGDLKHTLKGHTGQVMDLSFIDKTLRLASVSADKTWRVWDGENGKLTHTNSEGTAPLNALVVSPVDDLFVTAGADRIIRFWNSKTLEPIHATKPTVGGVNTLSITPDGHHLLVGIGLSFDPQSIVMDIKTGKEPVILEGVLAVVASAITPDGKTAALATGSQIEFRNLATGKQTKKLAGRGLAKTGVGFDAKGNLAWGSALNPAVFEKLNSLMVPGGPLEGIPQSEYYLYTKVWSGSASAKELKTFGNPDVKARAKVILDPSVISNIGSLDVGLRLPNKERPGLAGQLGVPRRIAPERIEDFKRVVHRDGSFELRQVWGEEPQGSLVRIKVYQDGKLLSDKSGLPGGCFVEPFTFAGPSNQLRVVRGGCNPSQFATDGKFLGNYIGHQGNVTSLAVSPDKTLLATGSSDQTVRLWNAETRELIATVFQASDSDWILWTPQGYYTASPSGDRMVGWHINQGPDREARHVSADQLRQHFYRPDIVSRAIELRSAKAAVEEARDADPQSVAFSLDELADRRPPEFRVIAIDKTDERFAEVTIEVDKNDDPVNGFDILVNDTQVTPSTLRSFTPSGSGHQTRKVRIPLQPGENRIQVSALNEVGRTMRGAVILRSSTAPTEKRGVLYVVAIGVNDYGETVGLSNLKYAAADAEAFHKRVVETLGAQHSQTKTLLVSSNSDRVPTSSNVRRALRFFRKAKPEDTTVVFLAGHGVQDGPDYLFLPSNAQRIDDDWDPDSVVLWSTLEAAISRAKGRRLLFVDTCRSGGAYNARLVKDTADSGVIAFSATNSEALAEERSDLGHGVFTYALLKGLEGEADVFPTGAPDGDINMYELAAFVTDKVNRMTNKAQQPELNARKFSDFVFATVTPPLSLLE
ncbi:MAG: caspase family protein [Hyphomicrobiaceae bacterium]